MLNESFTSVRKHESRVRVRGVGEQCDPVERATSIIATDRDPELGVVRVRNDWERLGRGHEEVKRNGRFHIGGLAKDEGAGQRGEYRGPRDPTLVCERRC